MEKDLIHISGISTPYIKDNKFYIRVELESWERDIILDALKNYIFRLKCVDTEHIEEFDKERAKLIAHTEYLENKFVKMEFNK